MSEPIVLKLSREELRERIESFVSEFLEGKSPETVGTYRRSLNEFERWFKSRKGRFLFRKKDIEAYRSYLTDERKLSAASVSTYLTALRRLCAHLVATGELSENPALTVRGNKRPALHTRDVLSESEVELLFEEVDGDSLLEQRDRAMLALMVYAGLSEIEIVRVDLEDLEQTLLGWELKVQGKGRSSKDARVELDAEVVDFLNVYVTARGAVLPNAPLFVSHGHRSDGERLQTRTVRSRINHHLKNAGLKRPGISPHSLTHTAPLLWLNRGMDVEDVNRRMRHGSLDTTMISLKRKTTQEAA